MLIWLSVLFNQKPLGTYKNNFSQREKLRSILETSIFSEKKPSTPHTYSPEVLIWKSLWKNLLSYVTKMIQQEQDSVTTDKGCRSY